MEVKQPTIQDVFEVLTEFKHQTEQKFEQIDSRFEQIDSRFEQIDSRFEQIDSRFDEMGEATQTLASHMDERFDALEGRVTRIESAMVTKDYLDQKLHEQKWEINEIISAENEKVLFLAGALQAEGSLSMSALAEVRKMHPFAK